MSFSDGFISIYSERVDWITLFSLGSCHRRMCRADLPRAGRNRERPVRPETSTLLDRRIEHPPDTDRGKKIAWIQSTRLKVDFDEAIERTCGVRASMQRRGQAGSEKRVRPTEGEEQ